MAYLSGVVFSRHTLFYVGVFIKEDVVKLQVGALCAAAQYGHYVARIVGGVIEKLASSQCFQYGNRNVKVGPSAIALEVANDGCALNAVIAYGKGCIAYSNLVAGMSIGRGSAKANVKDIFVINH